jgi:hypothetical protein
VEKRLAAACWHTWNTWCFSVRWRFVKGNCLIKLAAAFSQQGL